MVSSAASVSSVVISGRWGRWCRWPFVGGSEQEPEGRGDGPELRRRPEGKVGVSGNPPGEINV
ncbi:MAG: hypothetical protein ACRDS1_07425 [Pseudonocardiaceae bacterium]